MSSFIDNLTDPIQWIWALVFFAVYLIYVAWKLSEVVKTKDTKIEELEQVLIAYYKLKEGK